MNDLQNSDGTVQNEVALITPEKPRKPRKYKRVLDGETCLYKHWNANDELLYIGISLSAVRRLKSHLHRSEWFNQIATVTIQRLPTRRVALKEEARQIKICRPPYNTTHLVTGRRTG